MSSEVSAPPLPVRCFVCFASSSWLRATEEIRTSLDRDPFAGRGDRCLVALLIRSGAGRRMAHCRSSSKLQPPRRCCRKVTVVAVMLSLERCSVIVACVDQGQSSKLLLAPAEKWSNVQRTRCGSCFTGGEKTCRRLRRSQGASTPTRTASLALRRG